MERASHDCEWRAGEMRIPWARKSLGKVCQSVWRWVLGVDVDLKGKKLSQCFRVNIFFGKVGYIGLSLHPNVLECDRIYYNDLI